MKWTHYVRNRHRWADSPSEVRRMAKIAVDVQVRAIWYALIHDYRLGSINPPPTLTVDSQHETQDFSAKALIE
jgi:hypothetical protein